MINGKTGIKEFTLKNSSGEQVTILNYGGTIKNVIVPDRDENMNDVVLGFDTLHQYTQKENPFFGCITGRYANRIAGGKFRIGENQYQVPLNDGNNALHGGIEGFNRKYWNPEFDEKENKLELSLISPDGDEGYPGTLSAEVTYTFNDNHELRIDYRATTDQPTVINLTNHSYFNLSGGRDATVEEHEMYIHADYYIHVNEEYIPVGAPAPVEGTPMDFRKPVKIGKDLYNVKGGFDHTWVLNKKSRGTPELAAAVFHPATGRYMEVFTTQPGIQFYSGNFLNGTVTGKNGVTYIRNAGFCLETQHFPDAPNRPDFPSTILQPGQLFNQTTIYKFSVR